MDGAIVSAWLACCEAAEAADDAAMRMDETDWSCDEAALPLPPVASMAEPETTPTEALLARLAACDIWDAAADS